MNGHCRLHSSTCTTCIYGT